MASRALALTFALALCGLSCSSEKAGAPASIPTPDAPCAAGRLVGETCTGVPANELCSGDVCTQGVSCASVVAVGKSSDAAGALAGAGMGTCVALAAGDYGELTLPSGVSLLGKGAALVRVAKLTVGAGAAAIVRGVTVGAGGLSIEDGVTDARIESVAVIDSAGSGLTIGKGVSVVVAKSEIRGAARYGIATLDTARVRIEASRVEGSKGPGLWAECAAGCACAAKGVTLSMSAVVLNDNRVVGLSLIGVNAELDGVDITANAVADDFSASGGVSISQCSMLSATRVRVLDNSAYGMLIDGSSAKLGSDEPGAGVEVSRNTLGIWIQHLPVSAAQPVVIRNAKLLDNAGVGIGLLGDGVASGQTSVGIHTSDVGGTASKLLPSIQDGVPKSRQVGHGIAWMAGAKAEIDGLSLHANSIASLLVDGEVGAGSLVRGVTLSEGDETLGIIQQNLPATRPPLDSLPGPQRDVTQRLALPSAPLLPGPQREK